MFKADGGRRLGGLRPNAENEVVELPEFADLLALIDAGDAGLTRARSTLTSPRAVSWPLAELELVAPLDPPRGNVIAIGRNYQKHAEETAHVVGGETSPPTIFTKAITSLTDPFADIAIDPSISDKID